MKKYKCFLICLLGLMPLTLVAQSENFSEPAFASCHHSPILTTSAIIEVFSGNEFKGIILVNRHKKLQPSGKALPSGRVFCGEKVEDALCRKMKSKMNLDLDTVRQFHVYTDLTGNCIFNTVDVVHLARIFFNKDSDIEVPLTSIVKIKDIPWNELASDNIQILRDYIDYRDGHFADMMIKP